MYMKIRRAPSPPPTPPPQWYGRHGCAPCAVRPRPPPILQNGMVGMGEPVRRAPSPPPQPPLVWSRICSNNYHHRPRAPQGGGGVHHRPPRGGEGDHGGGGGALQMCSRHTDGALSVHAPLNI